MITRAEVDAYQANLKASRPKMWPHEFRGPDPALLKQAQVATQQLTGHPAWDVFLQRVQKLIDDERVALNGMADTMLPNMTSENVLMVHRHMLAAKARIEAWERVLEIPKAILGSGEQTASAA